MQSPTVCPHRTLNVACRFRRVFVLSWPIWAGLLGTVPPAVGQNLTYGTYSEDESYEGGTLYSNATPGGFNYTNGLQYQSYTVGGVTVAQSFANLNPPGSLDVPLNQLNVHLGAPVGGGYTSALAEMWDTVTFGGLAQFGSGDYPGLVAATLTMEVNATAPAGYSASAAWGLDWFPPAFAPSAGANCGLVASYYQCGYGYQDQQSLGTLEPNGNPTGSFAPGTYSYSIQIPLDDLIHGENGKAFYIATIAAFNTGGTSLVIDPSITVTVNPALSGVTFTSASGLDYAPVPLPTDAWLLGSGLLGLICLARRRHAPLLLLRA